MNDNQSESVIAFELGPIRPPSESQSILLRLTRNCPWNKCAFCPVYKGQKFSTRSVDEVKSDIDSMVRLRDMILEKINEHGLDGKSDHSAIHAVKDLVSEIDADDGYIRQMAYWMYFGMKSLFLQDADSLTLKTDRVVEILRYVREKFPSIERVTSYSRAKTISKKTIDEMKALREAGLNRIHIGMESGSDRVLDLVCKGVTQLEQIDAGKKAMEAGFELSEYFMPGVGGAELMRENALESAKVLSAINPTFIRIRSVIPAPGTPLFEMYREGTWTYPSEEDKVKELRLFIENLHDITSSVKSDHIMNLLEDVEGVFPDDKKVMLQRIDRFLAMDLDDRESFIVGRRMGRFHGASDYEKNEEVDRIKREIKRTYQSLDQGVLEMLWNYI